MKQPDPLAARLRQGVREILDQELSTDELDRLRGYIDLLVTWQGAYRLLGSSDRAWIVDEIVLDSLLFVRLLPPHGSSLLDLGSGAGIPGIPIGIVRPRHRLVLLEARRRRASFLATLVRQLGLGQAEVVCLRAEEAIGRQELAGRFDIVVSRCAGEIRRISRLAAPLMAPGGRLIVSGPPAPPGGAGPGRWVTVDRPMGKGTRNFFVLDSSES